jgi:hypothetical protein
LLEFSRNRRERKAPKGGNKHRIHLSIECIPRIGTTRKCPSFDEGQGALSARLENVTKDSSHLPRTTYIFGGFMKVLVAKNSDEILGFAAFGFEASEQMAAMQTAMLGHLPYTTLRDAIFTQPTMSEGRMNCWRAYRRDDADAGPSAQELSHGENRKHARRGREPDLRRTV